MSSTPPTPTPPPTAADAPLMAQPPSAPASPPFSLRRWIRDLNPFAKGAIVAVLLLLLVAWYVFTGRVPTDDAPVDCPSPRWPRRFPDTSLICSSTTILQ